MNGKNIDNIVKHHKLKNFLESMKRLSQGGIISPKLKEIEALKSNAHDDQTVESIQKEKGAKIKKLLENVRLSKSCEYSFFEETEFEIPPKKERGFRIMPAGISVPQFPSSKQ